MFDFPGGRRAEFWFRSATLGWAAASCGNNALARRCAGFFRTNCVLPNLLPVSARRSARAVSRAYCRVLGCTTVFHGCITTAASRKCLFGCLITVVGRAKPVLSNCPLKPQKQPKPNNTALQARLGDVRNTLRTNRIRAGSTARRTKPPKPPRVPRPEVVPDPRVPRQHRRRGSTKAPARCRCAPKNELGQFLSIPTPRCAG